MYLTEWQLQEDLKKFCEETGSFFTDIEDFSFSDKDVRDVIKYNKWRKIVGLYEEWIMDGWSLFRDNKDWSVTSITNRWTYRYKWNWRYDKKDKVK